MKDELQTILENAGLDWTDDDLADPEYEDDKAEALRVLRSLRGLIDRTRHEYRNDPKCHKTIEHILENVDWFIDEYKSGKFRDYSTEMWKP